MCRHVSTCESMRSLAVGVPALTLVSHFSSPPLVAGAVVMGLTLTWAL